MMRRTMKPRICKLCKHSYESQKVQQFCDSCQGDFSDLSDSDIKQHSNFKTKKISKKELKKEVKKDERKNERKIYQQLRQDFYPMNQKELQYLENLSQNDGSLSEKQKVMLEGLNRLSERGHKQILEQVNARYRKIGYEQTDVLTLLQYIQQQAPITIFFNGSREINYLANNTLFNNESYSKSQSSINAYLNICNDLQKAAKNQKKGQSYFVLKDSVRKRCLISIESANSKIKKTNLRYGDIFLSSLSETTLRGIIDGLFQEVMEEKPLGICKQIQILGQLKLERDIQQICFSQKQGKGDYINVLQKIKAKFGIDYRII